MTGDPAYVDYDEGMEPPLPGWIDDDFIQAVVDVAAGMKGPRLYNDHRPSLSAKALARHLRLVWSK
jgi:hypothetical protein